MASFRIDLRHPNLDNRWYIQRREYSWSKGPHWVDLGYFYTRKEAEEELAALIRDAERGEHD